jgi:hypothetical protein
MRCAMNSPTMKWWAIKPMLPNKPRGVQRLFEQPVVGNGSVFALPV